MKKCPKLAKDQRTLTNQIRSSAILVGVAALVSLVNGCANDEGGRKSAVDAGKLCGGAKDVVFAGSCLERGSSLGAGDTKPPPVPDKTPPVQAAVPPGDGGGPADTTPVRSVVAQILSFNRDSFVAIADQVVKGNCFVPKGTTIEFKGEFAPVTQFKSFGVNQNIALNVVAVKYPEGQSSSSGCSLEGKNFVYLVGHAEVAAKP